MEYEIFSHKVLIVGESIDVFIIKKKHDDFVSKPSY